MKIGRNDPCHCGSGQKYKKCCSAKDDAARSAELAAQAAARAAAIAEAPEGEETAQAELATKAPQRPAPNAPQRPKGAPTQRPAVVRKHAV